MLLATYAVSDACVCGVFAEVRVCIRIHSAVERWRNILYVDRKYVHCTYLICNIGVHTQYNYGHRHTYALRKREWREGGEKMNRERTEWEVVRGRKRGR